MDARHTEPKVVVLMLCCAVLLGGLGECVGGKPLSCLCGACGARPLMHGVLGACSFLSVASEQSAGYFGLVFSIFSLI